MPVLDKLGGISSEAVRKATGHDWSTWVSTLDAAGAGAWDHKRIVAYLKEQHGVSSWWRQMVTVAYEQANGRRVVGQTADTGFQLGVQKSLPLEVDEAWKLLTSRKGIRCWLGETRGLKLTEGSAYRTESGVEGQIRVVKPGNRLRLTWQRPGMKRPAVLQLTLVGSGLGKTALRVHVEHLPSKKFREEMKTHWKGVLGQFADLA